MNTRTKLARTLARRRQRGMTLLEIMIVLAILALVMGLVIGPKLMSMFGDSKKSIAETKVKQLVQQDYAAFTVKSPSNSAKCPTYADLTGEDEKKNQDPWGNPYKLLCKGDLPPGVKGFAAYSFGEDGKDDRGANDDIKSWDQ